MLLQTVGRMRDLWIIPSICLCVWALWECVWGGVRCIFFDTWADMNFRLCVCWHACGKKGLLDSQHGKDENLEELKGF